MKHSIHINKTKDNAEVLFVNVPGSSSYYFNTICNAGYNYADKERYELPHLLEHLAFEGSKNYPKPGDMSYELEKLGGWYNAMTSEQNIRYFLVGSIKDYHKITELGLEQYTSPLFNEDNIVEQKEVVEREFKRQIDNDGEKVRALTYTKLFPDKLSFAKDRIATLKNITKKDIESYYKKTHTRANTTFVIAGDLPEKKRSEILSLIEAKITALPIGTRFNKINDLGADYGKIVQSLPSKLEGQLHFSITFIKPDYETDINYRAACVVAKAVYNRGDSSRIFRKSRAKGLAYTVNSGIYNGHDYSEMYVIDKTDPHLASDLFKLCLDELLDLRAGNITDEELVRAKGFMAGGYDTDIETSRDLADWYGPIFVDKEPLDAPEEFAKAIRKVTKADVISVMNKFVKKDNWLISLVGHGAKSYEKDFGKIINSSISKI